MRPRMSPKKSPDPWCPPLVTALEWPPVRRAPERTIGPGRRGLPEPKPYQWQVKERQREQEVAQELAEIRAELRARLGAE
jgi:hypothetical protein